MPMSDLLLGTNRLRRKIAEESVQFGHDIERVKTANSQLREVATARLTSPLALVSATAAGFIAGKLTSHSPRTKRASKQGIDNIIALTLTTARSLGMQVLLPMVIAWVQTKFSGDNESAREENKTPTEPID